MLHPSTIYALDYSSNRTYDRDGRMRVNSSIISASQVDGYYGGEIPRGDQLGLDPSRLYRAWRHPEELAKGASSFNGLQLLVRHVAVNAEDHKPTDTVGAAGNDATFTMPYLRNSLTIWSADAIRKIEDKSQHEISCGYCYDAEMKSGTTPQGEPYDLIMRNISGNHIALVDRGRVKVSVVGDGLVVPRHISNFIHDPRRKRIASR